ncbi:phosphatidylglycerol lysyltransferase domain-containing protein [Candidatus Protochlamydia phocaeensis]|uniref:phosphatidylglycerol lysyltransferase domain-containing protein n=1 Tax=Candidatus Protochlamydia phocaeensis TaxID=1414722 RepID=UPI0008383B58|nr:phosphatidylglycerol lysyltransferase domain-containing protein [Candidatus Protochlamydia phocaeensis]
MELVSSLPLNESNQRERELCVKYGSSASEAMFDFPCHFFYLPDCTGTIAYRIESNCAVVFGDPICPPQETEKLAEGFYHYCQDAHLNIIYIIVSENFAKWAKSSHCSILMEVCQEFIFDPAMDPCQSSHRLQHRVDKAIKHGLTIHEYIPFDDEIEKKLKQVGEKWQQAIKGPHIYLGHLNFFESYVGKRWFYVKDGDQITSMLMLSRVEANQGWLLKFLATLPDAFHDTSEFLVTSVLSILRKENCRFLTKGMMPVDALGEINGFGPVFTGVVRGIYKIINWTFKFNKRKEYWLRYHPKAIPAYLLFSNPSIGLNEIKALIKVFRT